MNNLLNNKKVAEFLGKFYTNGYGQVYYNPNIKYIYIMCGDEGIIYWEGDKNELIKQLDEYKNSLYYDKYEESPEHDTIFYDFFSQYGIEEVVINGETILEDLLEKVHGLFDENGNISNREYIKELFDGYVLIGQLNNLEQD
jgi:hypothetical protein